MKIVNIIVMTNAVKRFHRDGIYKNNKREKNKNYT